MFIEFICSASVGPTSAECLSLDTTASSRPGLHSATFTSAVGIDLIGDSTLCSCTAHSAGAPQMQCNSSWAPWRPKRCTRNAHSWDLSDESPAEESTPQPQSKLDCIAVLGKIISKSVLNQENLRPSSVRAIKIQLSEPRSFNNVFPAQRHVGYGWVIFPPEMTSKITRTVLQSFCRMLCNEDRLYGQEVHCPTAQRLCSAGFTATHCA